MDNQQTNGGRETLIEFPEKFPIKIFGLDSSDFTETVEAIIAKHVEKQQRLSWESNISSKGKYLAITVTILATSQEQLDSIYMDLTSSPQVKMAL